MKKVVTYKAKDWREFDNQRDCLEYEVLLDKVDYHLKEIENELKTFGYEIRYSGQYSSFHSELMSLIRRSDKSKLGGGIFKNIMNWFGSRGCHNGTSKVIDEKEDEDYTLEAVVVASVLASAMGEDKNNDSSSGENERSE